MSRPPVRFPSGPATTARGIDLALRAARAADAARSHPGGPLGALYRLVSGRARRQLRRHIDAYGPIYVGGRRLDAGHGPDGVAVERPLRTPREAR